MMRSKEMFGRVAAAVAVAAAMGVSAGAQGPHPGWGPLWWMQADDPSYSRHHDRWWESRVEGRNMDPSSRAPSPWSRATSFPSDRAGGGALPGATWLLAVYGAPPNSACDLLDGAYLRNVGPPYPGVPPQVARPRQRPEGWAGLQVSMHLSEWYQGRKYFPDLSHALRLRFGFFDVGMRDNDQRALRPPSSDGTAGGVDWIDGGEPGGSWILTGLGGSGAGFTVRPCLGVSLVKMHGDADSEPDGPFPLSGGAGDCYADARAFIIRANSEGRCEPDLSNQYDYTRDFWAAFRAVGDHPVSSDQSWLGVAAYPTLFPEDPGAACPNGNFPPRRGAEPYYCAPYLLARRGEVAVLVPSEDASSTGSGIPDAWDRTARNGYAWVPAGEQRGTVDGVAARFTDPLSGSRDPFDPDQAWGSGSLALYNSGPGLGAADAALRRECIELDRSDPRSGAGLVDACGDGRASSRFTSLVNRKEMGGRVRERDLEAGPVDTTAESLSGVPGRALIADSAPPFARVPWPSPPGYRWTEQEHASMACLFMEHAVHRQLVEHAETARRMWADGFGGWPLSYPAARADHEDALRRWRRCPPRPVGSRCRDDAEDDMRDARRRGLDALGYSAGWGVIRDYREYVLVPEMETALGSATLDGDAPRPQLLGLAGYGPPSRVLRAVGLTSAEGNIGGGARIRGSRGCVSLVGNPALAHSYPLLSEPAGSSMIPAQRPDGPASMWYGDAFEAVGAHPEVTGGANDWGALYMRSDRYTQFGDVAGRTTPEAESSIRAGSAYPSELRGYPYWNSVRTGSKVFREFACKTVHAGYYGMSATALGTSRLDHRNSAAGRAWIEPDDRVSVSSPLRRFSSGTPCTGDAAYDALGCFDYRTGVAGYSFTGHWNTDTDKFKLAYSGDGASDSGAEGQVRVTRPTPYNLYPGTEVFELTIEPTAFVGISGPDGRRFDLDSVPPKELGVFALPGRYFFNLSWGYVSLDIERRRIWAGYPEWDPVANPGRGSWLRSGETYGGAAPGGCPDAGCDPNLAPVDAARLEHQGPLRSFGAMIIGGTGGCTLTLNGGTDAQPSVVEAGSRVVCLLPANRAPLAVCPRP